MDGVQTPAVSVTMKENETAFQKQGWGLKIFIWLFFLFSCSSQMMNASDVWGFNSLMSATNQSASVLTFFNFLCVFFFFCLRILDN